MFRCQSGWIRCIAWAGLLGLAAGSLATAQTPADPPASPPPAAASAGDEPEIAPQGAEGLWATLVLRWKVGGPTMYPLAFVGLVGLVFGLDRLFALKRSRVVPHGLGDRADQLWQAGDYAGVVNLARSSNSTFGRVIAFIVEHRSNPYEMINRAAEDIAGRDFDVHSRRNQPLLAVGTISPLLGLMGTVFGLMGAFASIGVYGSMDDPSVLAGDIGEAMVTTAFGLIIAVPALGVFHYFRLRANLLSSLVAEETSNLMHAWFLKKEQA